MRSWWLGLIAIGSFAGCSSAGGSSFQPGAGGNIGVQGCTQAPDCSICNDCYSLCVCQTNDPQKCQPACGIGSGGTGGGSGGGAGTAGTAGAGGTAGSAAGGSGGLPASGAAANIRISEISVYQAVKVPLMTGGGEVGQRNAPVVIGRDGVVRVSVEPMPGWVPREVVARFEVDGSQPFDGSAVINGPSSDSSPQSTINIQVPGSVFAGGAGYSLSLLEGANGGPPGDTSGSRFPVQGKAALNAESSNGAFQVMVVPIVMNGNAPLTGQNQIAQYRDRLFKLYPVPDVEVSVHAPVNYGSSVSANGSGWSSLLQWLLNLRQQENPKRNVYYYGVFAPTSSAGSFCGQGCVAGLSLVPSSNENYGRGSIGLGFFPSGGSSLDSPGTLAHELGHATGRQHAPCMTQDAGPFPYSGGRIGVWGLDITNGQLKNPSTYADMMGYCNPDWISDYNFKAIQSRISFVNSSASVILPPGWVPTKYRVISIEPDGRLVWGGQVELSEPPTGEPKSLEVLDAAGKVKRTLKGVFYPVDHLSGGLLLVEDTRLSLPADAAIRAPQLSSFSLKASGPSAPVLP